MRLRRTLLAAALLSSFAALVVGWLLNAGAPLEANSVGHEARGWTAAPLLAFAIVGTMGCLVGALTVRR